MVEAVAQVEMFKIIKDRDEIRAEEFFSRIDSDRTRDHRLRVRKRRVKTVIKQRVFHSESS